MFKHVRFAVLQVFKINSKDVKTKSLLTFGHVFCDSATCSTFAINPLTYSVGHFRRIYIFCSVLGLSQKTFEKPSKSTWNATKLYLLDVKCVICQTGIKKVLTF